MKRLAWLAAAALVIPACGGGSSGGGGTSTPAVVRPVAVAGDDQKALPAVLATLNGASSHDDAGGPITYQWTQTSGAPVVLSDATVASPTFTTPGTAGTLTFSLTVTSPRGSDSDSVSIVVKTLKVSAPDKWFAGYGTASSISAVVAGGTGPFTYQWSGIEPWLAVSGETTDILAYTVPGLTDFQNFPDRADVAPLHRTSQGRLQLKIRATDSLGAFDEDFVNFSAGPFADAVANENLALGEPAFLNGAATIPTTTPTAITTWTWSGIKPSGAAVSFFKPDKTALAGATNQRYVYFVPDLPGDYEIQVKQNDGLPAETTKFLLLTAGSFVGAGNRTGTPPDPFKGECASCHAGQFGWLADFATPWASTGHAKAFERLLDPAKPLFAPSQAKGDWRDAFNFGSAQSIDSRTVGWSRITAGTNDGWAQRATADGFVFKDASHAEMVRKHPSTAALSGVQCESCHGPGSEHRADTTGIRKTFDSAMCARCHAAEMQTWEASGHGKPVIVSPSGNSTCNNCHTAQGYVVEARAQKGVDPHPALFSVSNLSRPVIPLEDRRGTTCQACHDPHERTVGRGTPADQPDPQLRVFGRVQFVNGAVVDAGNAASCFLCHQSRRNSTAGSTDFNERRGPHDSTAAEMLSAANGSEFSGWTYSSSPHGIASRFVTPALGENRSCLACHKDAAPGAGAPGFGALGGHSFAMKQGSGLAIADEVSHAGAQIVPGTRKFSVTGGPGFLQAVVPGDILTVIAGANTGAYTVAAVDGNRQVTLAGAGALSGGAATDWSLTSTLKYNTASCTQCHTTAGDFEDIARADYDGNGFPEPIQTEVTNLIAALKAAIEVKLVAYTGVAATLEAGSSVKYRKTVQNVTRTFPGAGVTSASNPDLSWASLSSLQKAQWDALYKAAYNIVFVQNDKSGGIHNTGYAVNLLQASYQAVTGSTIGSPFVPFP